MLEEEGSWEVVIVSTGLDGPGGEVVTVDLNQKVDVELRRSQLSVHFLVIAFLHGDTLLRPERLEFQPERLDLLYSSDDLEITRQGIESGS